MHNLYEGIILRSTYYKDNDKILTLFTRTGKISLIAKSVKNGKRQNLLDIGNLISYNKVKTKGLDILTTVIIKNSFANIKETNSFYILFLLEVVLKIQRDSTDESLIYNTLIFCIKHLENTPKLYLCLFLEKMLYYEGVFIDLYICNICGEELSNTNKIIISSEGLSHLRCTNFSESNIDNTTIKLLKYLSMFDIDKNKVKFSIDDINLKEALFYLILFTENFFSSKIKSTVYLNI